MDDDFEPAFSLGIVYPSAHREVKLGNKIKPADVSSAPVFEIRAGADAAPLTPSPTSRSNATYTLVLTDPDATSRADPIKAEMCHWIVTGINLNVAAASTARLDGPGPEASTASAFHRTSRLGSVQTFRSIIGSSETSQLMSYYPPAPPPKTGYHRYVFVLLAPASTEKDADLMKEPKKPKERPHWGYGKVGKGVRDWADENRLVPVGELHTELRTNSKDLLKMQNRCQFLLCKAQQKLRRYNAGEMRTHRITNLAISPTSTMAFLLFGNSYTCQEAKAKDLFSCNQVHSMLLAH